MIYKIYTVIINNASIIGLALSVIILLQGFMVNRKIKKVLGYRKEVDDFNIARIQIAKKLESYQRNLNENDIPIVKLHTEIRNQVVRLSYFKTILKLDSRTRIFFIHRLLDGSKSDEKSRRKLIKQLSFLIAICNEEKEKGYGK